MPASVTSVKFKSRSKSQVAASTICSYASARFCSVCPAQACTCCPLVIPPSSLSKCLDLYFHPSLRQRIVSTTLRHLLTFSATASLLVTADARHSYFILSPTTRPSSVVERVLVHTTPFNSIQRRVLRLSPFRGANRPAERPSRLTASQRDRGL